ncbi:hypothetical protein Q3G72_001550 [Acer saccharum]|nr:hypothetical protein Q3G72_030824 [Acer saccharum]KAK1574979.1 hypothetical protein Q3G72_001550 [Acer saccharum]
MGGGDYTRNQVSSSQVPSVDIGFKPDGSSARVVEVDGVGRSPNVVSRGSVQMADDSLEVSRVPQEVNQQLSGGGVNKSVLEVFLERMDAQVLPKVDVEGLHEVSVTKVSGPISVDRMISSHQSVLGGFSSKIEGVAMVQGQKKGKWKRINALS